MTPHPNRGPWSHELIRAITRSILSAIGLFRRRQFDPDRMPWQAHLIVGCANLAILNRRLTAPKLRRLYRLHSIPWNLRCRRVGRIVEQDLGGGLQLRLYHPVGGSEHSPALLYLHGGGFSIGGLNTHDVFCRYIAYRAKIIVVSVDYRLAPEFKYPAQIDDGNRAYHWLISRADEIGIDRERIAIGGDSAGGTLALSVALSRVETGNSQSPALLWMIYPWLELDGNYPSYDECRKDLILAKPLVDFFREQYLPAGSDPKDPALSPGLAVDLTGLPPVYLVTAGYDPLRDEGFAFAKRLGDLDIPFIHEHRAHLLHDFLMIGGVVPEARDAINAAVDALAAGLSLSNKSLDDPGATGSPE